LKCIFVSDIHGKTKHYKKLFDIIKKEKPDGAFLGGDLLPNSFRIEINIEDFIQKEITDKIKWIKKVIKKDILFFIILGNDDPRIFEKKFLDADKKNLIKYVNYKTVNFNNYLVSGYSYVPPTPFQLKDWERYDISQFVDVGSLSPELGIRTIKVDEDEIRYSTIVNDLEKLTSNSSAGKTIFLFHAPPHNTFLDRAELDGVKVDHAPVDVHVGSIAIKRFIENKQPLLTLHGHIHESTRLTGHWMEKIGKTFCFSAAHDGPEMALIRFDTDNLKDATRELIDIS